MRHASAQGKIIIAHIKPMTTQYIFRKLNGREMLELA